MVTHWSGFSFVADLGQVKDSTADFVPRHIVNQYTCLCLLSHACWHIVNHRQQKQLVGESEKCFHIWNHQNLRYIRVDHHHYYSSRLRLLHVMRIWWFDGECDTFMTGKTTKYRLVSFMVVVIGGLIWS